MRLVFAKRFVYEHYQTFCYQNVVDISVLCLDLRSGKKSKNYHAKKIIIIKIKGKEDNVSI